MRSLPHGAPHLSKMQLWGIGLFIIAIASPMDITKQSETSEGLKNGFAKTLMIAVCWFLSWLFFT